MLLFNLAGIYARAGRIEEGVDMAEGAARYGFRYKPGFENDPDLSPLQGHPRYQALLATLE